MLLPEDLSSVAPDDNKESEPLVPLARDLRNFTEILKRQSDQCKDVLSHLEL